MSFIADYILKSFFEKKEGAKVDQVLIEDRQTIVVFTDGKRKVVSTSETLRAFDKES